MRKNSSRNVKHGLTLIELIAAMVIMAVIASLAMMRYGKFMEKARYDNTRLNIIAIHSAIEILKARNVLPDLTTSSLSQINALVGLHVIDDDFSYLSYGNPQNFVVEAKRNVPVSQQYTIQTFEGPISEAFSNPLCYPVQNCP